MKQGDLLQIVKESMELHEARNPESEAINKIIRKLADWETLSKKEERFLVANGIDVNQDPDGWTNLRGSNGEKINSDGIEYRLAASNGDFDFYRFLTKEHLDSDERYDYNDPRDWSQEQFDSLQPYADLKKRVKHDAEMRRAGEMAKRDIASMMAQARAKHGKKNESVSRTRRRKMNEGWRGCDNIEMEYYNDYADPSLVYNGYRFNYYDIEDALWNDFLEDTGYTDDMSEDPKVEQEFNSYVQNYAEDYLDDVIWGGYFEGDSHDWRDRYNESFKRMLKEEVMGLDDSNKIVYVAPRRQGIVNSLVKQIGYCFVISYNNTDEMSLIGNSPVIFDEIEKFDQDALKNAINIIANAPNKVVVVTYDPIIGLAFHDCGVKTIDLLRNSTKKVQESLDDYDEFYIEVDPSSATPFTDMLFTAIDEGMAETVGREAVSYISEDDAEYICKILGFVE